MANFRTNDRISKLIFGRNLFQNGQTKGVLIRINIFATEIFT